MKCPNCGNNISDNRKYCLICGEPLKTQSTNSNGGYAQPVNTNSGYVQAVNTNTGNTQQQTYTGPKDADKLTSWCVLALLLFWPLAIYGFSKRSEARRAATQGQADVIVENAISVMKKWLIGIAVAWGVLFLIALVAGV